MEDNNERLEKIEMALSQQRGESIESAKVRPDGMSFSRFLLEGASLLDSQDVSDLSDLVKSGGR